MPPGIPAKVYSHKQFIGDVNLQLSHRKSGRVAGHLNTSEYYSHIRYKIQDINSGPHLLNDFTIDSLRINIQLNNGFYLFPQSGFTIGETGIPDGVDNTSNQILTITAQGLRDQVIDDFILSSAARDWPLSPWKKLPIEQKIQLEDALYERLGRVHGTKLSRAEFEALKGLARYEFSAVAQNDNSRAVLFEIHSRENSVCTYVHVSIPPTGKLTNQFYSSLKIFRRRNIQSAKAQAALTFN